MLLSVIQKYMLSLHVFGSVFDVSASLITCLMPFFRPSMTDSSISAYNRMGGKSAFPTVLLLHIYHPYLSQALSFIM
jgi:hypothetical protein